MIAWKEFLRNFHVTLTEKNWKCLRHGIQFYFSPLLYIISWNHAFSVVFISCHIPHWILIKFKLKQFIKYQNDKKNISVLLTVIIKALVNFFFFQRIIKILEQNIACHYKNYILKSAYPSSSHYGEYFLSAKRQIFLRIAFKTIHCQNLRTWRPCLL